MRQRRQDLVNNKGDINQTLKDLGRSETAKHTLTAALTAGALHYVNDAVLPGVLDRLSIEDARSLQGRLVGGALEGTTSALVSTSINGGSLKDNLEAALLSNSVNATHGFAASLIKTQENNYLLHKILHAAAGCAAAAANRSECEAGAIGAAVGEVVAEQVGSNANISDEQITAISQAIAGTTAAYAGYDVNTAISIAKLAVSNNYLTTTQQRRMSKEMAPCLTEQQCEDIVTRYENLSKAQDAQMQTVCKNAPSSSACRTHIRHALNYVGDVLQYAPDTNNNPSIEAAINTVLKNDLPRSRNTTLDLVMKNPSIYNQVNDINMRADFFGAMAKRFPAAKWFAGAEAVSRRCGTGLGASGCAVSSSLSFAFGSIGHGVNVALHGNNPLGNNTAYKWRDEAGKALMQDGYQDFRNLWEGQGATTNYRQWDIDRLVREQTALQPIHEKYLEIDGQGSFIFVGIPKRLGTKISISTDPNLYLRTDKVNMLDLNDRIRYGCQMLGYNYQNGVCR